MLLSASLLSMSMSLARVLRAALFFVMWSFVSIVLASEVFLNKLPQEVVREDLKRLEAVVPKEAIERAIERLQFTSALGSTQRTAVVLGGNTAHGYPLASDKALASRLESLFAASGLAVGVRDASFDGATSYDIAWLAREKVAALRPDLVFVVGWSADKVRGGGVRPASSYFTAPPGDLAMAEDIKGVVTSSMLGRWLTSPMDRDRVAQLAPNVAPDEYRRELADAVRALQSAGSMVILVAEPVVDSEDRPYREAMVDTAVETQSLFLSSERILRQPGDTSKVFSRGVLLSSFGYETLARGAVSRVRAVCARL